jgi:hypothetical protein
VAQDNERWLVTAVDVVEDDEQGAAFGHPSDGVAHVLKEPEAVRRRRHRTREHRIGIHIDGAENLTPWPEGGRAFDLGAAAPGDGAVVREGDPHQLLGQLGLADPGLARAQHDASRTDAGGVEPPPQCVKLPLPPDDPVVPHTGKHHSPGRIPKAPTGCGDRGQLEARPVANGSEQSRATATTSVIGPLVRSGDQGPHWFRADLHPERNHRVPRFPWAT